MSYINGASIPYKNVAEITRAAGLNSARTVKKAISGERVSIGTAKAIYRLCLNHGFAGEFADVFANAAVTIQTAPSPQLSQQPGD